MSNDSKPQWVHGQAYLELVGGPFCGESRLVSRWRASRGVQFMRLRHGELQRGRYVLGPDGRMWHRVEGE